MVSKTMVFETGQNIRKNAFEHGEFRSKTRFKIKGH